MPKGEAGKLKRKITAVGSQELFFITRTIDMNNCYVKEYEQLSLILAPSTEFSGNSLDFVCQRGGSLRLTYCCCWQKTVVTRHLLHASVDL